MYFEDRPRYFAAGGPRIRGRRRHRGGGGGGGGGDWTAGGRRMHGWRQFMAEQAPRVERGGVRYLVLDAIADTPRHGYEIMAVIDERSRGAYRPSPGVTYPTLQLLEELGHVRVSVKDDKKVYALTASGTKELDEHADDVAGFYEQAEGVWQDHGDELFELVDTLPLTPEQSAVMGLSAMHSVQMYTRALEDVIAEVGGA